MANRYQEYPSSTPFFGTIVFPLPVTGEVFFVKSGNLSIISEYHFDTHRRKNVGFRKKVFLAFGFSNAPA